MTFTNVLIRFINTLLRTVLATEEYELNIILTDKNNIIVYEEIKVFRNYTLSDVQRLINKIKQIGSRDE